MGRMGSASTSTPRRPSTAAARRRRRRRRIWQEDSRPGSSSSSSNCGAVGGRLGVGGREGRREGVIGARPFEEGRPKEDAGLSVVPTTSLSRVEAAEGEGVGGEGAPGGADEGRGGCEEEEVEEGPRLGGVGPDEAGVDAISVAEGDDGSALYCFRGGGVGRRHLGDEGVVVGRDEPCAGGRDGVGAGPESPRDSEPRVGVVVGFLRDGARSSFPSFREPLRDVGGVELGVRSKVDPRGEGARCSSSSSRR
mmetsp:Transcript_30201/g.97380  ORF Transcript_30201/g.97380 Transcript_30201/m.97380 type:complete len:251 (-) Transcript_30201:353-1105(-)